MPITSGSVCSGIEATTLAWKPLGMRATWLADRSVPQRGVGPPLLEHAELRRHESETRCWPARSPHLMSSSVAPRARPSGGRMREGLTDPRGALPLLTPPRHEYVIPENVSRKLKLAHDREALRIAHDE